MIERFNGFEGVTVREPGAVSDVGMVARTDAEGGGSECDILRLKGLCSGNRLTTPLRLVPSTSEDTWWERCSSMIWCLSLEVYGSGTRSPPSNE